MFQGVASKVQRDGKMSLNVAIIGACELTCYLNLILKRDSPVVDLGTVNFDVNNIAP